VRNLPRQGLVIAFVVLSFLQPNSLSAEALDGEALYKKHRCTICHGVDGRSPTREGYPAVAGQNRLYLVNQILDIRDGIRTNGRSNLMRPLIKTLRREEIQAIAEFLSSRK